MSKDASVKYIKIRGAREHNLKNINVDIPKNKLVVITGLSGSGKSTLAFDTIYAEGQRRYVESMSSYARQFLNLMPKPDVDKIEGLSPSIAIEQKTISKNSRSTVGTVTEIYDYLRLLFSRIGIPYSPATGLPIQSQTVEQVAETVLKTEPNKRFYILAPMIKNRKGEFKSEFETLRNEGFSRVFIDGELYDLAILPPLQKNLRHNVSVVVDRIRMPEYQDSEFKNRVATSVETALRRADGTLIIKDYSTGDEKILSEHYSCPVSGFCIDRIEPRLFSFNNPKGACPACTGLGFKKTSFEETESKEKDLDIVEPEVDENMYIENEVCPVCNGSRLCLEAMMVKIDNKTIADVSDMSIDKALEWILSLSTILNDKELEIAEKILVEIRSRMQFIINVGLEYLTLSRSSESLSGGESQRIRLASQIGAGLSGVVYVLDEPSIGLHQRDNDKLIKTLKQLKDGENSIIVVEHDEDTMNAADLIVDIGPKAGVHGGEICAIGTVDEIKNNPKSPTGVYLSRQKKIEIPRRRRINFKNCLEVVNAHKNNLQHINVKFPLGVLTCVTGVSGSGKSTLVLDTLFAGIYNKLHRGDFKVKCLDVIRNIGLIDKIIDINQAPIGRTPRSNPITYVGCFTDIRNLYAGVPEARLRGYNSSRFSFNIKGGRCEACRGDGVIRIEMHFLPDIYVTCDQCGGKRFTQETRQILFKGKSISDVLDMTIDEATTFFKNQPAIYQKLSYLNRVGLGYLTLGHKATILSGGEAQRVKLAKELSRKATGKTLYILDEPTTGLHTEDISKLLEILQLLIEAGNSVIVIEHNMDVIKTADWVIDIGPEGGVGGGKVVATGTPEMIAECKESYTGRYLRKYLGME